ncbi:hypothetical protein HNY73_015186 [Argiope bruennichi]|uniref:Uncharacterized protein n=1 Tax=Argiope bruennichi TaxID=94029 RepID=A0A8T0EVZ2_ARGBR|nr:hypothetical protein HNY73_015186 [Argiope bruennichi]
MTSDVTASRFSELDIHNLQKEHQMSHHQHFQDWIPTIYRNDIRCHIINDFRTGNSGYTIYRNDIRCHIIKVFRTGYALFTEMTSDVALSRFSGLDVHYLQK